VFGVGGGNPGVLYGYVNNRLGIDLPIGFFENTTKAEIALYNRLSPEGKAGYMGLRERFNNISDKSDQKIGLVNAQKAWVMQRVLEKNLDSKLPQKAGDQEPSIVKDMLTDATPQGRDLIKALNENNMPIPEFYRVMLGVTQWQSGMPVFYQKLPEEITDLPKERTEEVNAFIEQYS
jgi:hypothetical protein